ncbi:hypothetical protein PENSPDRAFT_670670 [Peniophora sp. CONT]|nr:hypothetical protein PENSPDRAFT_670670 [Peniophora sp. CONT]
MDAELEDIRSRLLVLEASQDRQTLRSVLDAILSEVKLIRRDLAHIRVDLEYSVQIDSRQISQSKLEGLLDRLSLLIASDIRVGDESVAGEDAGKEEFKFHLEHSNPSLPTSRRGFPARLVAGKSPGIAPGGRAASVEVLRLPAQRTSEGKALDTGSRSELKTDPATDASPAANHVKASPITAGLKQSSTDTSQAPKTDPATDPSTASDHIEVATSTTAGLKQSSTNTPQSLPRQSLDSFDPATVWKSSTAFSPLSAASSASEVFDRERKHRPMPARAASKPTNAEAQTGVSAYVRLSVLL